MNLYVLKKWPGCPEHPREHIPILQLIAGHIHPLYSGQLVADQLLKRLLQLRIPRKPHLVLLGAGNLPELLFQPHFFGCAADQHQQPQRNVRTYHAHGRPQLKSGHECSFIKMIDDIVGNQPLSLGKLRGHLGYQWEPLRRQPGFGADDDLQRRRMQILSGRFLLKTDSCSNGADETF